MGGFSERVFHFSRGYSTHWTWLLHARFECRAACCPAALLLSARRRLLLAGRRPVLWCTDACFARSDPLCNSLMGISPSAQIRLFELHRRPFRFREGAWSAFGGVWVADTYLASLARERGCFLAVAYTSVCTRARRRWGCMAARAITSAVVWCPVSRFPRYDSPAG